MAYKKYKKYYKEAKSDYKKLKGMKKAEKKTATTKEVGDKTAVGTLVNRIPVFTKASQLIKNMAYYDGQISGNSISSAPQYFFKANGIYDPNDTGFGHSAIGHDQMMAFYEHWCVIRSNISVTFTNMNTTTPVRVGITLTPDKSSIETRKLIENGYVKTVVLSPQGSSGCTKTVSLPCDVKNYFGRGSYKEMLNDERMVGSLSTDPFELVHYGLFVLPAFNDTDATVRMDAIVQYDTIYFEPKKLPISG